MYVSVCVYMCVGEGVLQQLRDHEREREREREKGRGVTKLLCGMYTVIN